MTSRLTGISQTDHGARLPERVALGRDCAVLNRGLESQCMLATSHGAAAASFLSLFQQMSLCQVVAINHVGGRTRHSRNKNSWLRIENLRCQDPPPVAGICTLIYIESTYV